MQICPDYQTNPEFDKHAISYWETIAKAVNVAANRQLADILQEVVVIPAGKQIRVGILLAHVSQLPDGSAAAYDGESVFFVAEKNSAHFGHSGHAVERLFKLYRDRLPAPTIVFSVAASSIYRDSPVINSIWTYSKILWPLWRPMRSTQSYFRNSGGGVLVYRRPSIHFCQRLPFNSLSPILHDETVLS